MFTAHDWESERIVAEVLGTAHRLIAQEHVAFSLCKLCARENNRCCAAVQLGRRCVTIILAAYNTLTTGISSSFRVAQG
jgi:hypothetical protein